MMEKYGLSKKALSDRTFVINSGRMLDNNNAHDMVEAITEAQSSGYTHIILDMSGLEFISSAGVGSILGTVEKSREQGGDIVICNASNTIQHVFKVLDLTDYLNIQADMQQATKFCGITA